MREEGRRKRKGGAVHGKEKGKKWRKKKKVEKKKYWFFNALMSVQYLSSSHQKVDKYCILKRIFRLFC
jgi:hypothetical protein